ncbi:MAG: hypothetical protein GXY20_03540 [Clostridiales bacterium]|nr:hypothetical protein [Clostridiales bacterium]
MGRADEQHPAQRGGIGAERPDLRLKPLPTVSDQLTIFSEAEEPAKAESSAFSISQQIIDEVLTSGGNELNSPLRIVSYFKKDHPTAENADFLRQECRRGGKGFIFGGNHVSVWFDESGICIATGDTVLTPAATLVNYEQAAKRIRELLDMGRYMPQSELDKADGLEIKAIAEQLWYLERDLSDGMAIPSTSRSALTFWAQSGSPTTHLRQMPEPKSPLTSFFYKSATGLSTLSPIGYTSVKPKMELPSTAIFWITPICCLGK